MQDHGKFAPLSSELQNGDEVEVLTSEASRRRHRVGVARGHRQARAAIRRATRTAVRDHMPALGAALWSGLFARAKIEYADDKLKGALAAAGARLDRRRDGRCRPRRDEARRRARDVSRLQEERVRDMAPSGSLRG